MIAGKRTPWRHGHRQPGAGADLQKPDSASLNIYKLCVDGEGF